MNIGLDLHGVIDHNPDAFRDLAEQILREKGLVIVISGALLDDLEYQIDVLQIPFSRLYSITDYLVHTHPTEYIYDKYGRPSFPIQMWNAAKGNIIRMLRTEAISVDIHIDDNPEYGEGFPSTTEFMLYEGNINYEMVQQRLASRSCQCNTVQR